ncbi:MerR family transcriptional regulator [Antarcticibacterium arcticum]|uniref:MerR family transcriptional regulator n=1 Tax=Antarcticibacterium arcticum TaxID=2585771 RepID=A0A5B8YKU3_9FLAO|nr:chaperone modulator CbpM [Antarcticibacterium arcticum]QED38324.1 MerR family transcriptional regulator [Antarcticibacterium arcticum]
MNLEELIATEELCERYKVEHTFIRSLSESGLIEIITIEQREYVHCDRMAEFEKMRRLHYDLEINLEGLEAVHHLLNQLRELQKTNRKLQNRLNLYE